MILNELTGVKRFHSKSRHDLFRMLDKFGIKIIGGGRYGTVLTHANWDYVVKVFSDDPQYLSFVNFVIENPNPHYPKVVRKPLQMHAFYKRLDINESKFWIVKIEKLQPIQDEKLSKFLVENIEGGALAYEVKNIRKEDPDARIAPNSKKLMPDGQWAVASYKQLFKYYPWFESLCGAWYKLINSDAVVGATDLHSNSFMQRADGTIVMIDPVWEGSSPYQDFDRMMRAEHYYDEVEGASEITGPTYPEKKKPQPVVDMVNSIVDAIDDDIPF